MTRQKWNDDDDEGIKVPIFPATPGSLVGHQSRIPRVLLKSCARKKPRARMKDLFEINLEENLNFNEEKYIFFLTRFEAYID